MALPALPAPKLVQCLREGYSLGILGSDLIAGATVGLVALPGDGVCYRLWSSPQNGVYYAIVAGFTISALGGSRVEIGGPTGAFVVVVSGIVAQYGLDGLVMCTLLAGVILILLGITGLGTAVKYIPRPVVIGFTNGIGVLITSTQIRDLFGLQTPGLPGGFIAWIKMLVAYAGTVSGTATLLGFATVAAILAFRRVSRRIPGSIIVLVVGTAVAFGAGLTTDTIGSRFGRIPTGLPALHVPAFRPDLILTLLSPALTVRARTSQHGIVAG